MDVRETCWNTKTGNGYKWRRFGHMGWVKKLCWKEQFNEKEIWYGMLQKFVRESAYESGKLLRLTKQIIWCVSPAWYHFLTNEMDT